MNNLVAVQQGFPSQMEPGKTPGARGEEAGQPRLFFYTTHRKFAGKTRITMDSPSAQEHWKNLSRIAWITCNFCSIL